MTVIDDDLRVALVGAWELIGVEHQLADGPWERTAPARGRLVYTPDGYVSVIIMFLPGGTVPDRFADDQLTAYSGRYTLQAGPTVEHVIDLSFRTRWIGSTQVRHVGFQDGELRLVTADFQTRSGTRRSRLRWRRPGTGTT